MSSDGDSVLEESQTESKPYETGKLIPLPTEFMFHICRIFRLGSRFIKRI
jgi:hypothetical protein